MKSSVLILFGPNQFHTSLGDPDIFDA